MTRHSGQRDASKEWDFAAGVYSARDVVRLVAPLLEKTISSLGVDPPDAVSSRKLLVDGLAALLSPVSRESAMPIPESTTDPSRREMARQSFRIGKTLTQYVDDISEPSLSRNIRVQNPREGYLWTDSVRALLQGPRSNKDLMHLYDEWLHQMVLLRDVLLPFQNYAEVRLSIQSKTGRGLRDAEGPRSDFLVQCLTRTVSQTALVDLAKTFTAPSLPSGGYGVQYSHGLVLPAFLSGSSSIHLLRFHGAHLDGSVADPRAEILFDYEFTDDSSAPRSQICDPIDVFPPRQSTQAPRPSTKSGVKELSLVAEKSEDKSRFRYLLKLHMTFEGDVQTAVDIGQIARGRRYAQQMPESKGSYKNASTTGWSSSARVFDPRKVLAQPGLVSSHQQGLHLIPAMNPAIGLALLGKLYPENVVMLSMNQPPAIAEAMGRDFGPKFVLFGGDFRNQLICPLQEAEDRFVKV